MKKAILGILLIFTLMQGCLFGGDATNTAEQLAGVRSSFISNGLLVPSSVQTREQYRDDILPFRSAINSVSGKDGETLRAYLDGSLALLSAVEYTDEALRLLGNVKLDAPDCGTNSPVMKAVRAMENARKDAQHAHTQFVVVQDNPTIANALGADYVLNAVQTSLAVYETHGERINDLKSACGITV